jgi:hypothetical protein
MKNCTNHFYIVFIVANLIATITFGQVTKQEVSEHLIELELVDAKYLHEGSFNLETINKKDFIPEVQLFDFVYDTHPIISKIRVASYQNELFVLPSDFSLLLDKTGAKLSDIQFFNLLLNAVLGESDMIENIYQKDETFLSREFSYHATTWEEINGIRKKWSLSKKGDRFDIIRVEILEIFYGTFIRRNDIGTPGIGNVSYINFTHVSKFEKGQVRFPVSIINNDGEKISFIEQGDINDALKTENVVVVHNDNPTSEVARTVSVTLSTFTPFSNVTVTIDIEQSGLTHQIYNEVHTVNALGSRTFNVVLDPTIHTGKYTLTADGLVFTIVRSFFVYRTRTGALPNETDYQYRIYYGSQFTDFDIDEINSLVTDKESVLTNVYNAVINQWGFPSPKSIDADNFLDQYFGSFDNYFARRIMNCPNIEFGYFYAGLPRIEYYVSNSSYTDALEFMHAADVHEFLHSVQYTYPDIFCNWTGSTQEPYYSEPTPHRNYIIEGQARFLQTVYLNTIDPDNNAEFEFNSMYWQQSVNYLIGFPMIGMLPGLSRGLGLLSYDYAIFWRFLYENNNPSGSDAARLSIITEVLDEVTGTNPITGAKIAFDNALSNIGGNYDSYAEAKKDFAKRIYLNDSAYGLWNPCPSDAFYPKPDITKDGTLVNETIEETDEIPFFAGIDFMEFDIDDDIDAVKFTFDRDPNNNGHGDFYVNLLLLDNTDFTGEIAFDINNAIEEKEFQVKDLVNKVVVVILRLDTDENNANKADYQVTLEPSEVESVEIAICLDRSGSMQGSYMTAAKNASKTFVDMMQFNDYLAVTSFAASASVNYPFTQLVDEQDKTNAKNAINSIATGGWTSIGSGMQKSQSELNKGNTDQTQAMLLLSDGYENEPPYVSNVIPTIPGNTDIYTIALGPDSDQTLLNNIAVQTGGFYSYAPGASRLNLIYNSIRAKVTGQEVYASFTESLDQGQTQNHNVFVDGGTTFVIFSLTWSGDELDIELTDPNGLVIDENSSDPNVSYTFGPSYKTFSITNPESGEYVVNILNPNKARQSTNYNFVVSGESTLNMSVTFDKSIYGLNEPIQVVADITDGTLPVTGASITAEVTVPAKADFIPKGLISKEEPEPDESLIKDENGNYYDEKGELRYEKATLVLNDNGDGTYSNSFTNTNVQGSYSFDIFASGIAPLSGDFTRIDNQSTNVTTNQSIVVTQPQTGALWESGTSQTVQWSTTNISGNVNIYLSTDGGSNYNIPLALDTPDVGTLAVLVPNIPSDVCRIKVESVDNSSISGINPGNFSITAPPCTQAVDISENWSLISSYVIPNDPELELVFEDISDNLLIMLSKSGIFWPSQNINTLGEWNAVEGYKIKMAEQAMLCMNGDITEIETVNLIQGANYLPVLSQNNVVATDIFNQIEDELIFAFDLDGAIYWPEGGLFDLQVLEPGKAYLLLLNAEASVTFGDPDSGKAITGNKVRTIENSPWKVANTGNAHLISIYSSAVEGMNFGDIIGVFTSDGLCVGLTQYIGESGNLPLVVYGNDFTTEQINGLVEGEAITLKVYDPLTQEASEVYPVWDSKMPNSGQFVENGLSAITSLKAATSLEDHSLSNLAVYPNPNTGLFTVTGIYDPVEIHVLNTSGQMIESFKANQSIEINLSNLAKGIYYLKVISELDIRIEKIIIK